MADKEITVFLVDAKAPRSYSYLYNVLAQKLLKGLKTDYVSVVEFHSATTDHPAAATGKFQGIRVLADFEVPTFDRLKVLRSELNRNSRHAPQAPPGASDAVQTVLFASTLLAPTKKKVFCRNIVVLTDAASPVHADSAQKVASVPTFYAQVPANLHFIVAGASAADESRPVFEALMGQFAASSLHSIEDAMSAFQTRPPVRKTRPLAVYKGEFRFGADAAALTSASASYDASMDSECSCFNVEMYPAVKAETAHSSAHEYLVDSGSVAKVDRKTSYFVWERSDNQVSDQADPADDPDVEKHFDKSPVNLGSVTPGFKFSNFDLIALDADLQEAARLKLTSALDVFGFIPSDAIPYSYFTDEAAYIVPDKVSSASNVLAFGSFVEALFAKKYAALCRFVRKQEKEVEVGAAFPVQITRDDTFVYCLVFIRLPFKEDEKIGNFPRLKAEGAPDKKQTGSAVDDLMDAFVDAKTCASTGPDRRARISNFKVTMQGSGKLPLPQPHSEKFVCSSPAAQRYSQSLQKILLGSLDAEDWVQHFENPSFIAHNLTGQGTTNLFNMHNCMAVNSDASWLSEMSEKAAAPAKRLVEELGIEYVRKEELKKQKAKETRRGDYGADEGTYAAVPDFGLE